MSQALTSVLMHPGHGTSEREVGARCSCYGNLTEDAQLVEVALALAGGAVHDLADVLLTDLTHYAWRDHRVGILARTHETFASHPAVRPVLASGRHHLPEAFGPSRVLCVAAGTEGLGLHAAGPGAAQALAHDGRRACVGAFLLLDPGHIAWLPRVLGAPLETIVRSTNKERPGQTWSFVVSEGGLEPAECPRE